jgi:hypothetical protein
MKNKMKLNKEVFLVEQEGMQKILNLLQQLPHSQVHAIINEILQLELIPVKEYITYEAKEKEEIKKD